MVWCQETIGSALGVRIERQEGDHRAYLVLVVRQTHDYCSVLVVPFDSTHSHSLARSMYGKDVIRQSFKCSSSAALMTQRAKGLDLHHAQGTWYGRLCQITAAPESWVQRFHPIRHDMQDSVLSAKHQRCAPTSLEFPFHKASIARSTFQSANPAALQLGRALLIKDAMVLP